MDKKGFTLVELIAVIVVLAVIIALVAPSLLNTSSAAKEKTFRTKTELMENSAVIYGQDNYRSIVDGGIKQTIDGIQYYTKVVYVKDLVPEYITKDEEKGPKYVTDPRQNGKFLDDYTITIMINTNTRKVTAKFNAD